MFVNRESVLFNKLTPKQTFYGKPVPLDPKVAEKVFELQDNMDQVSDYLGIVASGLNNVEIPSCLDVITVAKEKQPKPKASGRTSNSKSRKGSPLTAALSSMNQKTERSDT